MAKATPTRPTVARINLDDLSFNLKSVRGFVGSEVAIMAVVKADAYGHGAVICAKRLERDGAEWLAVALPEEGIELRKHGIRMPILCFGGFWIGQEELILRHELTPVIFSIETAERLSLAARNAGRTVSYHVKIDTGMGRVGVPFREAAHFAEELSRLSNLRIQGLMTHFASADDLTENAFTNTQIDRFDRAVAAFRERGFDPELVDMANSPGAIAHPASRGNMVRLGGVLYGLGGDVLPAGIEKPELRPVMSLTTKLAQIKKVAAGETLGYGRTFVTNRDSVIGTIPIGYQDGYRRGLSNLGRVIVNGVLAPVVGRISMDWTIVDLTDVPQTAVGQEVILIGSDGSVSITAEELAAAICTISYEITCGISARVPRIAVTEGDKDN